VPLTLSADDALDAVDGALGFATSGPALWRTADGGRHWTEIHSVIARR
jgi:photosystem II stability/assembly factor-like uncharacterized protein